MARPKRNPATVSEITESFSDMGTPDQEGLLSTLTEICRILKRERSRTAPLPTEWLTAPDLALQKRLTEEGNA